MITNNCICALLEWFMVIVRKLVGLDIGERIARTKMVVIRSCSCT
jgi:hypothetical protein